MRKALRELESSGKAREWRMLGTGWLWLARALNVAGAFSLAFALWKFLSPSLSWLLYFFISLAALSTAAIIRRRSVAAPAGPSETAAPDEAGARALREAFPPAPMFDREGRTPLERVFTQGEEEVKTPARGRAG